MYLQCTLYRDAIEGLEWYIIVLLPAVLQVDHLDDSSPLYYIIIAFVVIALLVGSAAIGVNIYFRNSKMVKLTQPVFTYMILGGGILLSFSALSLIGPNTILTCNVRLYLFNVAFTFTFAPLLIKSWRVHVLFNLNPLAKKKLISPYILCLYTMIFVLIDIIILTVVTYGLGASPDPKTSTQLTNNGAYAELTYCGYHKLDSLFFAELAFKGCLIAAACYLSFKTRNVVGAIAGCKTLLAIVYNTAFICAVIILVTRSLTDTYTIIVAEAIGICFCVITNAVMFAGPILYHVVIIGDDAAASEVRDSLFNRGSTHVGGMDKNRASSVVIAKRSSIHDVSILISSASEWYSFSYFRVLVRKLIRMW